eukprot:755499-Hanusia_phi.AAC.2
MAGHPCRNGRSPEVSLHLLHRLNLDAPRKRTIHILRDVDGVRGQRCRFRSWVSCLAMICCFSHASMAGVYQASVSVVALASGAAFHHSLEVATRSSREEVDLAGNFVLRSDLHAYRRVRPASVVVEKTAILAWDKTVQMDAQCAGGASVVCCGGMGCCNMKLTGEEESAAWRDSGKAMMGI